MNRRGAVLRWSGGLVATVNLILASLAAPVAAQERPSGEQLALDLRRNVIAISTTWADGTVHDGFGLITGERDGDTYIATADHVVRGRNPGEVADRITLQLFERQGRPVEGTVLGTRDADLDLAVVTARLPADVGWREDVLVPDPGSLQRGTEVWFVGRGGEWYVPTRPGLVNTVRRRRHEIVVDDLPVAVGTSGAPLVSASGIVGVVVSDEPGELAHATLIDVVASTFREWGHPWELTAVGSPPEQRPMVAVQEPTPEPPPAPTVVDPAAVEAALRLTSAQWREVQRALAALGHDPGPPDGVPGPATRAALRAWQRARGEEGTGYLTPERHEALVAAAVAVGVFRNDGIIEISGAYPEPGAVFRDCAECPEMVVLPGGTFLMGSPPDEEGRYADEGPRHQVRVAPLALGKHEVTFAEWDACVAAGGCAHTPEDAGWGRGRRPVIDVSWENAQQYVAWLSRKTGEAYRLPTEAEWEYAARAGTTTRYWWGNNITPEDANYGSRVGKTTEVGSYPANPWGLHDMAGNVWEWVADRWHESYEGAPADGSAWVEGGSSGRVVRGGSWGLEPGSLRSANRLRSEPVIRFHALGFRVARALTP
jgi:formylglycine-generating enzyme required for sulfatase activity